MQTMNQSLVNLVNRREIAYEDAARRSPDPKEFEGMLGRSGGPMSGQPGAGEYAVGAGSDRSRN